MVAFIDQYRGQYGVESICSHLPIAPSTYYEHKARSRNPERCSARSRRDQQLKTEITRIWQENFQVYGARKIWHQLKQEGHDVARCTVERLMGLLNIQGVPRGKSPKTTVTAKDNHPRDLVNRQFIANRPNQLWVADFTFVPASQGFIYVAFVVDVYARQIIGWKLRYCSL